jgi:hypothetical protein
MIVYVTLAVVSLRFFWLIVILGRNGRHHGWLVVPQPTFCYVVHWYLFSVLMIFAWRRPYV